MAAEDYIYFDFDDEQMEQWNEDAPSREDPKLIDLNQKDCGEYTFQDLCNPDTGPTLKLTSDD